MTYAVGTHIDLTHLNKNHIHEVVKMVDDGPADRGYETGTQFIFRLVNGKLLMGRRIHVAFA